jgi:hypothetical protein
MITNARSKGELRGAPTGEPSFNARRLDKGNRAIYVERAIHSSKDHDAVRLCYRWAFGQSAAVRTGMTNAASNETHDTAASRAAANVVTWRSYLPEECVVAMISDRWHWST